MSSNPYIKKVKMKVDKIKLLDVGIKIIFNDGNKLTIGNTILNQIMKYHSEKAHGLNNHGISKSKNNFLSKQLKDFIMLRD